MNKTTRVIAAGVTSIAILGLMTLPTFAQSESPPGYEESVCADFAPLRDEIAVVLTGVGPLMDARQAAVTSSSNDLNTSSKATGAAALTYIRALDGDGDETATEAQFTAAAAGLAEDLTAFVDAVDGLHEGITGVSFNQSVYNYLSNICPGTDPDPDPTPTATASPSPSPSPSPTPTDGGLGGLLGDLLGGLLSL